MFWGFERSGKAGPHESHLGPNRGLITNVTPTTLSVYGNVLRIRRIVSMPLFSSRLVL
jgi:hypothetical protein